MEHRLICKNLGLVKHTIIRTDNKTIISKGLNIEELVKFWKKELHISQKDTIVLVVGKSLYKAIKTKPLSNTNSALELFNRCGVEVVVGDNNG